MIMTRKKVLVSQFLNTAIKNVENTIAAKLMASVNLNSPVVTCNGDNAKTTKEKGTGQTTMTPMV